MIKQINKHP